MKVKTMQLVQNVWRLFTEIHDNTAPFYEFSQSNGHSERTVHTDKNRIHACVSYE